MAVGGIVAQLAALGVKLGRVAIAPRVIGTDDREHRRVADLGQLGQLLADNLFFEAQLGRVGDMLPRCVSGLGQARRDPLRGGVEDLDGLATGERGPALANLHAHRLAGKRAADEDHTALPAAHAVAALGHRVDVQLKG